MKKFYFGLLYMFFIFSGFSQANEKRIALVIGNNSYPNAPLNNPVNDANLMSSTLQDLGFTVIKRVNANRSQMAQAIAEFWSKLGNYNVALFFYAGHGVQVNGVNYLIPVDATLNTQDMVSFEAISVNDVVAKFEEYPDNTNIVILDACRNNPFRSWARGGNRGFKAMNPGSGTLIAFATSEGSTASDGEGTNGLFTEKLVKQIKKPVPVETVFKSTRVEVQKASGGNQSPQEWTKLTGDFYFAKSAEQYKNNVVDKPIMEEEQPKNNTSTFIISEEVNTGTIKITSELDGNFYFDGELKAKFSQGSTYTLNHIKVGTHKLKVEDWEKTVKVENGQTLELNAIQLLKDSRDGRFYKVVKIGNQTWMAENLVFNAGSGKWAYNNDQGNVTKFGYLYNWETAKYACPGGWHLPSKSDFETLLNNVGVNGNTAYTELIPGGNSGFSSRFGGWLNLDGSFNHLEIFANYWSSTAISESSAWGLFIYSNKMESGVNYYYKNYGFSVRCLQDK